MNGLAPITDGNLELLERLEAVLAASPVEEVRYRLAGRRRSVDEVRQGDLHEVDLDVRIVSASAVLTISWARDNLVEGLALTLNVSRTFTDNGDREEEWVSVSGLPEWTPFVGRILTSVVPAWHVTEDSCPRSVWSLRFTADLGASFVVSLGELDDRGVPTYYPDSLLVFFSEEKARSYNVLSSNSSAWADVAH